MLAELFAPGERFAVAALTPDRQIRPACFDDWELAEEWLHGWEGCDLYVTPNPVRVDSPPRPGPGDVSESRRLLIDFDPAKSVIDPTGLEEWKRTAARDAADRVYDLVGRRGWLVDSGRGTQIWLNVSGVDRERLIRWVQHHYAGEGVVIDSTWNPAMLARLPGSTNYKSGRQAALIDRGEGGCVSAADVDAWLGDWEPPPKAVRVSEACWDEPTAADRRYLTGAALKIWESKPTPGDRSKRDARLVLELMRAGAAPATCSRLMFALPGGKANEDGRGEDYWQSTETWAAGRLAEEERIRGVCEGLPDRCADDDSAAFESETLAAIAWLRANDLPAWRKLRRALKKAKVGIKDLEAEMRGLEAEDQPDPPDDLLRYAIKDKAAVGWYLRQHGKWVSNKESSVKTWAAGRGWDASQTLSLCMDNCWEMVVKPFCAEELEGRQWNVSDAQFAVSPAPGEHPTWDKLLRVVGRNLDTSQSDWAQRHSVDGARYLLLWFASLVQAPEKPLPYLFIHGEENIGKSMLHEAFSKYVLCGGMAQAETALKCERGFNEELAGAVLCTVEEENVATRRGEAINRIKAWVTSDELKIHPKGGRVYTVPNFTHWIQTANKAGYCPIFPGDSRITMLHMLPCHDNEREDKDAMNERLKDEAPAFLHSLQTAVIPSEGGDGRLAIPAVETQAKRQQQSANRTTLDRWLEKTPLWICWDDERLVSEFLDAACATGENRWWNFQRVLSELPEAENSKRLIYLAVPENGRIQPAEIATQVGMSAWSVGRYAKGHPYLEQKRSNGTRWVYRRSV